VTTFTATPLPDLAAVRLEVAGAAAGPLPITRTDRNGARLVRQLPAQETSAGLLAVVDYEAALEGDVRYDLEAPRTNALTNPSWEADLTGWVAYGTVAGTYSRDTTQARTGATGTACALLTGYTAGLSFYNNPATPAAAGTTWTGAFYVKGTAGHVLSIALCGYNSAGASVSGFRYDQVVLDGTWQRISQTYTLPETSITVRLLLSVPAATATAGIRVDDALLEQAPDLRPYLEGTDPAWPFTRTVTLGGAPLPLVTVPTRPQDRSTVKALEDYDEGAQSGTVRHSILGGGTVSNLRPLEARTGTLTLRADTYGDAAQVRTVLSGPEVCLFRQPTFAGLDLYFTVDGVRVVPDQADPDREWRVVVAFTEADAPAGPLLGAAGWTIDDLVALGVTIADVPALFATTYALAVGPS